MVMMVMKVKINMIQLPEEEKGISHREGGHFFLLPALAFIACSVLTCSLVRFLSCFLEGVQTDA